jgi:hypothetical protein
MPITSLLRTDILPDELTKEQQRLLTSTQFQSICNAGTSLERSRTPGPAKNLTEFYGLVKNAIDDYERRQETTEDAKIYFTEDNIDFPKDNKIVVSFGLVKRLPGSFSQGGPFEGNVVNMKPVVREVLDDPENPGYKRAILGYWHDNEVRFTIWARTNKDANEKALWFEEIMQEYSWYFGIQGVPRVLFLKREMDSIIEINSVKLYARPLHYFVRTETLRTVSEKTIENILINVKVQK